MTWQVIGSRVPRGGNWFTRRAGRALLRLMGWRVEGSIADHSKLIVAVAPHSSNLDFLLTIGVIWGFGLKANYLAKHTLFWFPLGALMRAFGGIPVDRSAPRRHGGATGGAILPLPVDAAGNHTRRVAARRKSLEAWVRADCAPGTGAGATGCRQSSAQTRAVRTRGHRPRRRGNDPACSEERGGCIGCTAFHAIAVSG